MEEIVSKWHEMGILDDVLKHKLVFIETKDRDESTLALQAYRKACDCGRGAVFLSVARGKVAEGIDFDGHYGRAVMLFGVPYQYTLGVVLRARMEYLCKDSVCHSVFLLFFFLFFLFCYLLSLLCMVGLMTPLCVLLAHTRTLMLNIQYANATVDRFQIQESEFLSFDALRQASQCVGRVIRSKTDYGLMIFADKRYARSDKRKKLPQWVQQFLPSHHMNLSTDRAVAIAREFLKKMAQPTMRADELGHTLLSREQALARNKRLYPATHAR